MRAWICSLSICRQTGLRAPQRATNLPARLRVCTSLCRYRGLKFGGGPSSATRPFLIELSLAQWRPSYSSNCPALGGTHSRSDGSRPGSTRQSRHSDALSCRRGRQLMRLQIRLSHPFFSKSSRRRAWPCLQWWCRAGRRSIRIGQLSASERK